MMAARGDRYTCPQLGQGNSSEMPWYVAVRLSLTGFSLCAAGGGGYGCVVGFPADGAEVCVCGLECTQPALAHEVIGGRCVLG